MRTEEKSAGGNAVERKAKSFVPLQRADGWCESAGKKGCSTFRAAGESRKGQPFIAETRGSEFLSDNLGGNAGESALVPVFDGRDGGFFISHPQPQINRNQSHKK